MTPHRVIQVGRWFRIVEVEGGIISQAMFQSEAEAFRAYVEYKKSARA